MQELCRGNQIVATKKPRAMAAIADVVENAIGDSLIETGMLGCHL